MPTWQIKSAQVSPNLPRWGILGAVVTGTVSAPVPRWQIQSAVVTGTTDVGTPERWRVLSAKVTGSIVGNTEWKILGAVVSGATLVSHHVPDFWTWNDPAQPPEHIEVLYYWDGFVWRPLQ